MNNDDAVGQDAPPCILYSAPGVASDICNSRCLPADELLAAGDVRTSPAVLFVDKTLVARIADARALPGHVVIVSTDAAAEAALGERVEISLAGVTEALVRNAIVTVACRTAVARFEVAQFDAELNQLSRMAAEFMCEHDRDELLRQIVNQGKRLTHSDGGVLFLTAMDEDGSQWLHPGPYAVDSLEGAFIEPGTRFPVIETSIVGHAVLSKEPVVIADAYDLPDEQYLHMNAYFDRRYGYRRRSMLVVPLLDRLDRVLGLLILVNRKTDPDAKITTKEAADRYVIEYDRHEVRLARILAGLAASAIENAKLYVQIATMLESFVEASVSAIDLRDPATAGHSLRVAMLVTDLAEAVSHKNDGPYRDVRFTPRQMRELRFAALVHDFGKVAVREDVLLKEKKLPPRLWERIDARFDLIARTMEVEACATRDATRGAVDEALAGRLKEVERCREVVRAANDPAVLDTRTAAELRAIARCEYQRSDGTMAPYLTAEELHFLLLQEGTLDEDERAEVESHAAATRRYLANVPWTDDLKHLVDFASDHHELLNGEGYPRHLKADEIALQTRIITMIDMFDALTAADRPYRHAVTPEQALEMLEAQAAKGRLDSALLDIMRESGVYRRTPAEK